MKIHTKFFSKAVILSAMIAVFLGIAPQNAQALTAVAQNIQGDVLLHKAGTGPDVWEAIKADTPLNTGDSIKTRKGSCVLVYSDQATFAMQENTALSVEEKADAQDIKLDIGKILGKVNKDKVTKPFQVVTPAAVAAVRGTEVDFGFNDQGQMTVDLHNGKIQVLNDQAQMKLDLAGKKQITVKYDKVTNIISLQNDCSSDGVLTFSVLGTEYSVKPCEEHTVDLATATGPNGPPNTNTDDPGKKDPNDPNEGREPVS
jgi:hypothetical protein